MSEIKKSQTLQSLEDPQIRRLVLEQLKDPLRPLRQPHLTKIRNLVNDPISDPLGCNGGLSYEAEEAAKSANLKEVILASENAREETRIKIRAVLATCAIFIKKQRGQTLTDQEESSLKEGIKVTHSSGNSNSKGEDRIQTVKKGGRLLTEEFKEMMDNLFRALPKEQGVCKNTLLLAAKLCQKEELKEKERARKLLPDIY